MIYQGKIRFVSPLHVLRIFSPSEKEEMLEQARYWHDEGLPLLFERLAKGPNPLVPERLLEQTYTAIHPIPSPERPLLTIAVICHNHHLAVIVSWVNEHRSLIRRSKPRKSSPPMAPTPESFIFDWLQSVAATSSLDDSGHQWSTVPTSHSSYSRHRTSVHPYHRRGASISASRLCGDEMSESGDSSITLLTDSSRTLVDSPRSLFSDLPE